MKGSTKAMIYSAIVFPGAGYFILKKHRLGSVFVVLTVILLGAVMYDVYYRAQIIAEQILLGNISLNPIAIRQAIIDTQGVFSAGLLSGLTYALMALWLVGMIDIIRLSMKKTQPAPEHSL